jgi:gamma-glutamylputrescine oxidase
LTENFTLRSGRRKFLKTTALAGAGSLAAAAAINEFSPYVLPEKFAFEPNESFWARSLPPLNAPLTQDLDTDVVIIGGGFTGLSAAYYLKRNLPNHRVVILEARGCGNGASGRNGAMLLTMTEDRYMQWSGDPGLDKRIYELTTDNITRLKNLSDKFRVDAELEQCGALQVCNTKEIAEHGRAFIEKARAAGMPFEYWDRDKISSAIGTSAYAGALFDPGSGQLHPGKLVTLFKAAAESVGVEIFEMTPVVHIEEGSRVTLTTATGTLRATTLVLATNAFTSKLGYLRNATSPVFDYVAMTAPLSETRLADLRWRQRIPFNDSRTEVFYLGLSKDNRIHIGGGPVDYVFNNGVKEPATAQRRFAGLQTELARIYPRLAEVKFENTWSGAVDMSLDQAPSVGRMGKHQNIFYAIGFSGHGVNLTSIFGRIIADLHAGKLADWQWLPYVNRLPPYTPNEPWRWMGVQAALGYYRGTDPKTP